MSSNFLFRFFPNHRRRVIVVHRTTEIIRMQHRCHSSLQCSSFSLISIPKLSFYQFSKPLINAAHSLRNISSSPKSPESSSSLLDDDTTYLKQQLEACQNGKQVSELIRKTPKSFETLTNFQLLVDKLDALRKLKMKPRQVAGLLNALSKLHIHQNNHSTRVLYHQLLWELSQIAKVLFKHMNNKDICIVLNALAKQNMKNDNLFHQAAKKMDISTMNSQDLAQTVNAYAKLEYHNPKLFQSVASAALPMIQSFSPQGLANLANAYAKVNHSHRFLFEAVADETVGRLTKPKNNKKKEHSTLFTAQGLANIVNAFAKTNHHNRPDLFQAIAKRAIPIMDTFNSQNLANTVNAYAKVDQ